MELRDCVGILTGASRGIGVYLGQHLAAKGVNLALAARSAPELEEKAKSLRSLGVRVISLPTDVNNPRELERLVHRTTEELGAPELLVNNAGIESVTRFASMPLEEIEAILRTNVIALEQLTRLVVPHMIERGRGHIVNIASAAGKTAIPYNTVYSSSKHAVVGFSWSLREELRPHGIGVSVICPGFVSEAGMFAAWNQEGRTPWLARTVSPDKVAQETLKAVERNRAEVIVTPGLGRVVDVFHAISPELTTWVARRGGLYGFLAQEAARKS